MRQIKAVFLDIDGTIISIRNHRIPQSAIDAICRVRQKGVKVFLCTSRAKQFLSNIGSLDFDGYVCLTGAHCLDADRNTICTRTIEPNDVYGALQFVQSRGESLFAIAENDLYVENPDGPDINRVLSLGGLSLDKLSCGYSLFPDILNDKDPIYTVGRLGIMQLTAYFPREDEDEFMSNMPHCHTERWDKTFTDIVPNGVDKALGISVMASYFGFDVGETMAVGDGGNDISMIRQAAVGVAMGNASQIVKDSADFVTDDVDNDGLKKALDLFV